MHITISGDSVDDLARSLKDIDDVEVLTESGQDPNVLFGRTLRSEPLVVVQREMEYRRF